MLAFETPLPNPTPDADCACCHVDDMLPPKCLQQQVSGAQTIGCLTNKSCRAGQVPAIGQDIAARDQHSSDESQTAGYM